MHNRQLGMEVVEEALKMTDMKMADHQNV